MMSIVLWVSREVTFLGRSRDAVPGASLAVVTPGMARSLSPKNLA